MPPAPSRNNNPPKPRYNPTNWYWAIKSIPDFVFSSARAAWVPTTDATYVAWLATPLTATIISGTASLSQVLSDAGLANAAQTALADPTSLVAVQTYVTGKIAAYRYAFVSGGVTVNGHPFATDLEARANWDSVYLAALGNSAMSIQWKLTDGTFLSLSSAQIIAIGQALLGFVQNCFSYEKTLRDQINAATSFAAVEAIDTTSGWPVSALTISGL